VHWFWNSLLHVRNSRSVWHVINQDVTRFQSRAKYVHSHIEVWRWYIAFSAVTYICLVKHVKVLTKQNSLLCCYIKKKDVVANDFHFTKCESYCKHVCMLMPMCIEFSKCVGYCGNSLLNTISALYYVRITASGGDAAFLFNQKYSYQKS